MNNTHGQFSRDFYDIFKWIFGRKLHEIFRFQFSQIFNFVIFFLIVKISTHVRIRYLN